MLKINNYDLTGFDSKEIDDLIMNQIKKFEQTGKFKNFFKQLNRVINSTPNFSFLKASQDTINKLNKINTHINVENSEVIKFKKIRFKKYYTLNDIIEIIIGYHIESRTSIIKRKLKSLNLENCVYCLAQLTTSYIGKENKIYVKGNLDHIIPKSINALVSLSINNLIPVCAHCNQRKLNAGIKDFDFNPFKTILVPTFNFNKVLKLNNGIVQISDLKKLEIKNINSTLLNRLELINLYIEYKFPVENLLERYIKFNSVAYKAGVESILGTDQNISGNLEYFISETPYTEENIQNIPLQKFKSDFFKELEEYKKNGMLKFN